MAAENDSRDESSATQIPEAPREARGASLAEQARSARPVRRESVGTVDGGTRATGPVQFARESVAELKKVVWPSWPTVQQYFWAVFLFVLIVITYVGLLDLGFGWLLLKLLG